MIMFYISACVAIVGAVGYQFLYNVSQDHWLQYIDPDEINREFVGSGFEVSEFYFDVSGSNFEA